MPGGGYYLPSAWKIFILQALKHMFRLFVVRKKTRKSIIPAQIFFPLQRSFKNIWQTQILPLCIWEEEKDVLSLCCLQQQLKLPVSTALGVPALGKGHTDDECTIGLAYRKFRFHPKTSAILIESAVSPTEEAAGSAVRAAFPSPLHAL